MKENIFIETNKLKNKKAVTLLELIVVVLIFGIASALFYTTFYYNWWTMDNYMLRSNLWQDSDKVMDLMEEDIRSATSDFIIINTGSQKGFTLSFNDGGPDVTYFVTDQGSFSRLFSGNTSTFLENVNFTETNFANDDGAVSINLVLREPTINRDVLVAANVQIYPRN